MANNQFDLSSLAGGAVAEQINMEIQKVYDNIDDPNTDDEKERKLTIEVKFKPKKNEPDVIDVSVISKSKLQPIKAIATRMLIGKGKDGKVIANEWDKGAFKNQLILDDGRTVTADGEIIEEETEEVETTENKVVDLQAKAK